MTSTPGQVRVLARRAWMETTAVDQLGAVARLPGVLVAVGLPDLHPGRGAPIGTAVVSTGRSRTGSCRR